MEKSTGRLLIINQTCQEWQQLLSFSTQTPVFLLHGFKDVIGYMYMLGYRVFMLMLSARYHFSKSVHDDICTRVYRELKKDFSPLNEKYLAQSFI